MFAIKYREMLLQVPGLYEELDAFYKRLNAFLRTAHADDGALLAETGLGQLVEIPYVASNFSAYPPMVWTVSASQVVTYAYTLVGRTATVYVTIDGAPLSGSPWNEFYLSGLPFVVAKTVQNVCRVGVAPGSMEVGYMNVTPGDQWIAIRRTTHANFPIGPMYVQGQITFPIV